MTTKADLLKIKPKPVEISVPGWGDKCVHVLPLTGAETKEHMEAEEELSDGKINGLAVIGAYVLKHLVDKDGGRVFEDDDLEELLELPWDGIVSVYHAITNQNVRRMAMVDGAKGNSKKTRG